MFRNVLMMVIVFATSVFYGDCSISQDDEVMGSIAANENNCVSGYDNGKIYLRPEKIVPSHKGLYLNLNGNEFILLPMLFSDEKGCYIESLARRGDPMGFSLCSACGRPYRITCNNPECPKNKAPSN